MSSAPPSVTIKDRLRPRKRKEKAVPSSEHPGGEETSVSKVPRTTTERSSPGPTPSNQPRPSGLDDSGQLTCSLRSCSSDLIDTSKQSRVEIQISLSDQADLKKLIQCGGVNWSHCGEAIFHSKCWEVVLASARSRAKSNVAGLTPAEKALVKEAAKTSERHSSLEEVKREAARIAELIRHAKHCVAFTGAGISTSAGIGDYRGKGGKWTEMDRREVTEKVSKDLKSETLIVRRQSSMLSEDGIAGEEEGEGVPYERLRPTYTHEALVKLVELGLLKYVISQNGDGLHLLSGIPEDCLSELHGNVFVEHCERCGYRYRRPHYVMDDDASQYYEDLDERGSTDVRKPPYAVKCRQCGLCHRTGRRCEQPGCGGYLKDSIINFGDDLEESILSRAEEHAGMADVMLSLGSTMQVTPACDLVVRNKKAVRLVIVNRQETNFDELCYQRGDGVNGGGGPRGSRVFGDCDALMRELMCCLLPPRQLKEWEGGREGRMKHYSTLRAEPT
jgi:mono-ADP-ribosyltransferase sirtuin 6